MSLSFAWENGSKSRTVPRWALWWPRTTRCLGNPGNSPEDRLLRRRRGAMVGGDLFGAEAKEARRIVVEDGAFLRRSQERRLLDHRHRPFEHARPDHLVRAEHHPVGEARFDDPLEIAVKGGG